MPQVRVVHYRCQVLHSNVGLGKVGNFRFEIPHGNAIFPFHIFLNIAAAAESSSLAPPLPPSPTPSAKAGKKKEVKKPQATFVPEGSSGGAVLRRMLVCNLYSNSGRAFCD